MTDTLVDLLLSLLLVAGAAFALLGSWALARLDDFAKRLHGPSKATTLGVGCVLLASTLALAWQGRGGGAELLVLAFLFVTAPVSAWVLVEVAQRRREQGKG
jgi:multicomponent K+:H+ antiporter subunit G